MHPKNLIELNAALDAWVPAPAPGLADSVKAARAEASPVEMMVKLFKLLSPLTELPEDAHAVLLGCAELIKDGNFHKMRAAAAAILENPPAIAAPE